MAKIWCEYCQIEHDESEIKRRRLNTAYVDDSMNWITCCDDAYKECVDYYKDLWSDYYSGIL